MLGLDNKQRCNKENNGWTSSMYDIVYWPLFFAYYRDTSRLTEVRTAATETFSFIDSPNCPVSSYQHFKFYLGSTDHIFRRRMIKHCCRILLICKYLIKQLFSFKVTS
jgi:hypothetical protein